MSEGKKSAAESHMNLIADKDGGTYAKDVLILKITLTATVGTD